MRTTSSRSDAPAPAAPLGALGLLATLMIAAPGCVGPPSGGSGDSVPPTLAGPPYRALSEHQRFGLIEWVGADGRWIVIACDPQNVGWNAGLLVVRDPGDAPRAVVALREAPTGRMQAAEVLYGEVAAGWRVDAPGASLREWGEARLAEEARP